MMENRPEYVCFWLGLSKLGVITALINTNLRKDVLVHSIKIGRCKCVVVSEDCLDGEFVFIGEWNLEHADWINIIEWACFHELLIWVTRSRECLKQNVLRSIFLETNDLLLIFSAIIEILTHEEIKNLKIYVYGVKSQHSLVKNHNLVNLSQKLESIKPHKTTFKPPKISIRDSLYYIYTSGTTGLPKAAIITHFRWRRFIKFS